MCLTTSQRFRAAAPLPPRQAGRAPSPAPIASSCASASPSSACTRATASVIGTGSYVSRMRSTSAAFRARRGGSRRVRSCRSGAPGRSPFSRCSMSRESYTGRTDLDSRRRRRASQAEALAVRRREMRQLRVHVRSIPSTPTAPASGGKGAKANHSRRGCRARTPSRVSP
jgi:hypothetical protein